METWLLDLVHEGLVLALLLGGPALAAMVGVGVIASLAQTVMHVQEPALTFVPKLLVGGLALLATASMLAERLLNFTQQVLTLSSLG